MRGRFFWRFGLLLVGLVVLGMLGVALLLGLAAGWRAGPPPPHAPGVFLVGRAMWMLFLLFVLFGILASGRAFRRVAAPVGAVMEAAGRVAEGDYSARVTERGPSEVRALVRAFNRMASRLETTDRERRTLLAEVSHELRTPLAVIQGNLEGLLDGVYPRDDDHLVPILEETRLLARLIDDLRTLALADAGSLSLQKEPTDVGELLGEAAASFRAQADGAGVTLEVNASDVSLADVDPTRIREVVDNLIANALRHTPRGGVVRLAATRAEAGDGRVTVSVADTGSGIAPEVLPHIFERFYSMGKAKGSGLGLTIARSLVEAHGGEITAESRLDAGTTVRFTLPAANV